jgi:hypothetical protein
MSALLNHEVIETTQADTPVCPIAAEFRDDGFMLRQVRREGRVAIYEKSKDGQPRGFEVVVLRIRPAETLFGRPYPQRESYPSSEHWGIYGWSYSANDLKGANRRFEQLVKQSVKNSDLEGGPLVFLRSCQGRHVVTMRTFGGVIFAISRQT